MATIKAFIRTTGTKKEVNIRFRLTDGRKVQLLYKSSIKVSPTLWDAKNECVKKRAICDNELRRYIDSSIVETKSLIEQYYNEYRNVINSRMLAELMDSKTICSNEEHAHSFFEVMEIFVRRNGNANKRESVIIHILERFESYQRIKLRNSSFRLSLDDITHQTLADIEFFIENESAISKKYPQLYNNVKGLLGRNANTVSSKMKMIRTFMRWSLKNSYTENRPFDRYSVKPEMYGTPYYLTLEERDAIANFPIENKSLATQRDIFIFQCFVGCRVSDLITLKPENIVEGFLEYIPHKTRHESLQIVRVPLSNTAMELIRRYNGSDKRGRLFPFVSAQNYNDSIKKIFTACGITRPVAIANPRTGKEEFRPINELASSHIARRTFVGNLYKKVKDPNLIASMSGHAEGSKAFARYRTIDDDIKKELIDLIE